MEGERNGRGGAAAGARLLREDPRLAAVQAREILGASPGNADAYRLLGAALRRTGEDEAAERAELDAIAASVGDPGADARRRGPARQRPAGRRADPAPAPHGEADRRRRDPDDGRACRRGSAAIRDAENLLRRALELAPAFAPARANLATVLYKQNRPAEAIAELDRLLDDEQDDAGQPESQGRRARPDRQL